MLKNKKQYKYIDNRCSTIKECIERFCVNKDPEEMHKLRVEIKKLRAFAAFAAKITKEDLKKTLAPVTKIFKEAGKIRTADIHLKLLKKYDIDIPGFKTEQETIVETLSGQFINCSQQYIQDAAKSGDETKNKCQDIRGRQILKFYKKKIDALRDFFSGDRDEKKLHARRKIVKMLLYVENLLPKNILSKMMLNTSYLDAMQDTIGEWHDAIITAGLLETHAGSNKDTLQQLVKEKEGLLHAIKMLAVNFEKNVCLKKTLLSR